MNNAIAAGLSLVWIDEALNYAERYTLNPGRTMRALVEYARQHILTGHRELNPAAMWELYLLEASIGQFPVIR